MKVAEFDYELPQRCIAQHPLERRDGSKLMCLERLGRLGQQGKQAAKIDHHHFSDLPGLLRAGDLLVMNDTRVLPARLAGLKPSGAKIEVFLLECIATEPVGEIWHCLARSSRRPRIGSRLNFGAGLDGVVLAREGEIWSVRLEAKHGAAVTDVLHEAGEMPLPPYIKRPAATADQQRYQTVFASQPGAVAAPTAGLHFTEDLLKRVRTGGVELAYLTLHVGLGTFQPVRVEAVEDHRMHDERFTLSTELATAIERTRKRGGRVIGVGTSVVRTLEFQARSAGLVSAGRGRCNLFIYPGFQFKAVDGMITNFHLPRSTLLMLVSAFAGRERILAAYAEAIARDYRFYSYGDAMLLS